MSPADKRPSVTVRWSGEKSDDPATVAQITDATRGLLDAITAEVAPDSGLRWKVAFAGIVCDGCGKRRPKRHKAWRREDGLDFCGSCPASSTHGRRG